MNHHPPPPPLDFAPGGGDADPSSCCCRSSGSDTSSWVLEDGDSHVDRGDEDGHIPTENLKQPPPPARVCEQVVVVTTEGQEGSQLFREWTQKDAHPSTGNDPSSWSEDGYDHVDRGDEGPQIPAQDLKQAPPVAQVREQVLVTTQDQDENQLFLEWIQKDAKKARANENSFTAFRAGLADQTATDDSVTVQKDTSMAETSSNRSSQDDASWSQIDVESVRSFDTQTTSASSKVSNMFQHLTFGGGGIHNGDMDGDQKPAAVLTTPTRFVPSSPGLNLKPNDATFVDVFRENIGSYVDAKPPASAGTFTATTSTTIWSRAHPGDKAPQVPLRRRSKRKYPQEAWVPRPTSDTLKEEDDDSSQEHTPPPQEGESQTCSSQIALDGVSVYGNGSTLPEEEPSTLDRKAPVLGAAPIHQDIFVRKTWPSGAPLMASVPVPTPRTNEEAQAPLVRKPPIRQDSILHNTWSNDGPLAASFLPPADLIHPGTFDEALSTARNCNKLLLVSIQDYKGFASHVVNRDVFSDELIQDVIREKFVFWQRTIRKPPGRQYVSEFKVGCFPHIGVIHPRYRSIIWGKDGYRPFRPKEADEIVERLTELCFDRYAQEQLSLDIDFDETMQEGKPNCNREASMTMVGIPSMTTESGSIEKQVSDLYAEDQVGLDIVFDETIQEGKPNCNRDASMTTVGMPSMTTLSGSIQKQDDFLREAGIDPDDDDAVADLIALQQVMLSS